MHLWFVIMDQSHCFSYISYAATGYFSKLAADYIAGTADIRNFYTYTPDEDGIVKAIEQRSKYPTDRQVLVSALHRQYEGLQVADKVRDNISKLSSDNTFTITTAHQPNLLTGYLYFIYKILHAIKLAEELNSKYDDKYFVPVYYMGSEDNDIEELGVFRFRGEKYVWDGNGQSGAVGRMATAGLKPLLQQFFRVMGPPGADCDTLTDIITEAYLKHSTIGKATQYLVNELFGRYGLVVIDPDDRRLKATFIPVMEDELLSSASFDIVTAQSTLLEQKYKAQAFPRKINLFYLDTQVRERIEQHGDKWVVLNTDITFTRDELLNELHTSPEKFSPNVILRGLFQGTILPDVAFIGGGAEVAYWLQLKTLFQHYNVFYPAVLLRQSVLWIDSDQAALRAKSGLDMQDIFKPELQLENEYVAAHSGSDWQTDTERSELEQLFNTLESKVTAVDQTLQAAARAALTRMNHQLAVLQQKMLRAEKRKMEVQLKRIERLKAAVFPGGSLQERTDNFAALYLQHGSSFFDIIKDGIKPLSNEFLIVEMNG
jgi:bacillithiol biosynthesis cysteine-adding enzyme BshC